MSDRAWTRATTLAKCLADTSNLDRWKQRMVATGIAKRPELVGLVAASLGDKAALDNVCEAALSAAGAGSRAETGTQLHTATEFADKGEQLPDDALIHLADVATYLATMARAGIHLPPEWIERVVVNPVVNVAGTFDRIARLGREMTVQLPGRPPITLPPGTHVIADLKTGRELSYSWGDIAIQLAIYANAPIMWRGSEVRRDRFGRYLLPDAAEHPEEFEPVPDVRLDVGLVMHLPAGERRCALFWVDLESGWTAAQVAASVKVWRGRRDLIDPIAVPS